MVKPEILVGDDEMSVRSVLVQVLERYGYAVTKAVDGEQALERLEEKNFALVITDIKMPGMSGLTVLKKTKQRYPDTQPNGKLTSSIGIATYPEDGSNRAELIKSTDHAMYQAKRSARNGVCAA